VVKTAEGRALSAATVVTSNERIAGTITGKTKTSVTIRMEDGNERTIERDRIVQIFDDNGEILYTSPALMAAPANTHAAADDASTEPGYHRHDGLYLRFLLGIGSLSFSESPVYTNGTGRLSASGTAGFFAFHLGFSLTDNVILYGALNGYSASNPDYSLNGTSFAETLSNTLGVSSYGGGLALYLDSLNAYISADLGTATTRITVGRAATSSKSGIGINLQIGKEWWVSKNWGLGAALFYHYSSMDVDVTGSVIPRITNNVIGVAFSATYN
jgi:hypothetical protein